MLQSSSRSFVDPCFRIDIGPAYRIVELAFHGLWDAETCLRCKQTLATMLDQHPLTTAEPRLGLYDLSDFPVQPQTVVAGLARVMRDNIIGSQRSAIVARSALLKSQLRRTAPGYPIFVERDHALSWLANIDDDAAA